MKATLTKINMSSMAHLQTQHSQGKKSVNLKIDQQKLPKLECKEKNKKRTSENWGTLKCVAYL